MGVVKAWLILLLAIVCEVIGTSALKAADGFSRFWPSVAVVAGYGLAFYCLSLVLRSVPVGVAYAVWSGVGTALIAVVGWLFMGQRMDIAAIAGISLIVLGVVILNVFSKSIVH